MTPRLVQWDPIRVHVEASALQSTLGDKLKLTFGNGSLKATTTLAGAPIGAAVALQAVNGGVTISITLLPPAFLDLVITGVEIVPDGINLLVAKGGCDLPQKSSS
jgi:hypothetical protein